MIAHNPKIAARSVFTMSEADITALLKTRCREKKWELKKTVDTQKGIIKKLKRGLKDLFDEKKTFIEVIIRQKLEIQPYA